MSFTLLLVVTAAAAASMGYVAARKHGDSASSGDDESDEKDESDRPPPRKKPDPKPALKTKATVDFSALPLALGDVVQSEMEERWLSGAIVPFEGDRIMGALFFAPEGKEHKTVAAFAPPRKDIWWMSPAELTSPDEPPATIELGGIPLQRKARIPVRLERLGSGAPEVAADGIWAVYDRGRDVALVITTAGSVHAWLGTRKEPDEYDRLGGGD